MAECGGASVGNNHGQERSERQVLGGHRCRKECKDYKGRERCSHCLFYFQCFRKLNNSTNRKENRGKEILKTSQMFVVMYKMTENVR